jgi:hypothetical protein
LPSTFCAPSPASIHASFLQRAVRGPLNDFGALKRRLDARIAVLNAGKALDHWTLHDFRRMFCTSLSTLGIAPPTSPSFALATDS